MATISDVQKYIEELAPTENKCAWDNDGLQVCDDAQRNTDKILLCLDVTDAAIDEAIKMGAGLIVSHHPLIFDPLKAINCETPEASLCLRMLKNGISHIAAHTRLDKANEGVNETLAELMGITDKAYFGEEDIGIIGNITPSGCKNIALFAKEKLGVPSVSYVLGEKSISRLAVVCGAGKDFLYDAHLEGADALLTGDVSYTAFMIAKRLGIALIDAGHFYTEFPILEVLSKKLCKKFPNIQTKIHKEAIIEEV